MFGALIHLSLTAKTVLVTDSYLDSSVVCKDFHSFYSPSKEVCLLFQQPSFVVFICSQVVFVDVPHRDERKIAGKKSLYHGILFLRRQLGH